MPSGKSKRGEYDGLSEREKIEARRARNTEVARENRKKWKENDAELQQLYSENEKRIARLEKMAASLSAELHRDARSSRR